MGISCFTRVALTWAPEGKRKTGKQREMWRRNGEKERKTMGSPLGVGLEAGLAAANGGILEECNFLLYSPDGERENDDEKKKNILFKWKTVYVCKL